VPVSGIQVISNLERPAAGVVVDVQHPHHRHARLQLQQPDLLRGRHPRPQQLDAAGEPVPQLLDQVVRPLRQRGGGFQPRPLSHPQRVIAGRDHRGHLIQQLQPLPDHRILARLAAQPGRDISRNRTPAGHQHPPRRHLPLGNRLSIELRLPRRPVRGMTMSRGDTPQRRPVPHIRPEPLAGHHQALSGQRRQRRPDRRPAHPVLMLELALGGELAPRPPNALLNLCPQHISQLQRKRAIRTRVKALRHHPPARTRSACHASTTGQRTAQTTRKPSQPGHPANGHQRSTQRSAGISRRAWGQCGEDVQADLSQELDNEFRGELRAGTVKLRRQLYAHLLG
jgi:hypothetical protein